MPPPGIGTLLGLPVETIYQAIGQALHTTTATRQSRKGEISTWKAHAPAFAGKMAVEAIDRAMRGQTSPSPIWEGEDGVIAWLLDGPEGRYEVPLPERGEAKRAILDTYTKEHSAEYQAQAWIDLARKLGTERPELRDPAAIASIVLATSHHTHYVIGSGANDPQKYDPTASRETLDHSIPYIFTVALQDGAWDHNASYAPERAARPDTVELWQKVTTVEDAEWTRRYHSNDPAEKAFGGRVEITLTTGERIVDEIAVADAHPLGARPFARADYVAQVPDARRRRARRRPRSTGSSDSPSGCPSSRPPRSASSTSSPPACRSLRKDCSDAALDPHRGGQAGRLPREARKRRADPDAGGLQPAERDAHPGQGLRGRLHLGRRAERRSRASRHRAHHPDRGRPPRQPRSRGSPTCRP